MEYIIRRHFLRPEGMGEPMLGYALFTSDEKLLGIGKTLKDLEKYKEK